MLDGHGDATTSDAQVYEAPDFERCESIKGVLGGGFTGFPGPPN